MSALFPFRNVARRLLYLDAQGLTVYRCQAGDFPEDARFADDAEGLAAFSEYLGRHRSACFTLIVDVVDEGFQIETLPPVRGRDRKALLSHRLAKRFPDTPYVTVVPQGREAAGRRDEKVLLAALTRPQAIAPWLAALRDRACRLDGLHSTALLAEGLLENLLRDFSRNHPQFLLLLQTRSGLRQTFFDNGRMQFSRWVARSSEAARDPEAFAHDCASESMRMRQYLVGQRRLSREAALPVALLMEGAAAACLRDMNDADATSSCRFVEIAAGSKRATKTPFCGERLLLSALLRRVPRHQFASDEDRLLQRVWQFRRVAHVAAIAISIACFLIAGHRWNEAVDLEAQTARIRTREADNRAQIERLPALPAIDDGQRSLVESHGDAVRHSFFPLDAYAILGEALDRFAQIRLERLDWRPEEAAEDVTMDVIAALPSSDADEDARRDVIGQFVAQLRKTAGVQASVVDLPVAAPATHADVTIGAMPATQKFSVRMRIKRPAMTS